METGANPLAAARPNGRPSATSLQVQKEGRKPLFGGGSGANNNSDKLQLQQKTKPDMPRYQPPAASSARRRGESESSVGSTPGGSRILKPATAGAGSPAFSQQRGRLTLTDAYKMAEHEDTGEVSVDASPSPAPRTWRSRHSEADVDNTPSASRGDKNMAAASLSKNRPDWRSRSRSKTGSEWLREPSDDETNSRGLPALVPGIDDMPVPSAEESPSRPGRRASASPEKSFNWQIDDDFTAGDLQVSDSPRVKVEPSRPFANRLSTGLGSNQPAGRGESPIRLGTPGSRNTKLDDIFARELAEGSNIPVNRPSPAALPRTNTKLDEIQAREADVSKKIPITGRRLSPNAPRTNTMIDDIRKRESQETMSRKEYSKTRLSEITEQNAASRQKHIPQPTRHARANTIHQSNAQNGGAAASPPSSRQQDDQKPAPAREPKNRSLFRPFARTSSSPANNPKQQQAERKASEPQQTETPSRPKPFAHRRALTTAGDAGAINSNGTTAATAAATARESKIAAKTGNGTSRPTVGFAGLRRARSTESDGSKRSSRHSEMDPTDRIEGEMKLFALQDNHSEKGSVRAPSPTSDSDHEKEKDDREDDQGDATDATPRPTRKADPLTMATPRVTGAYVETPQTVKPARPSGDGDETSTTKSDPPSRSSSRGRDESQKLWARDNHSDTGEDDKMKEEAKSRSDSRDRSRSRSRSKSRRQLPLKNSAKLPSVKDDMHEIRKINNYEDSTLDEFDAIITGRQAPPQQLKDETALQDDDSFDTKLDLLDEAQTKEKECPQQQQKPPQKQPPSLADLKKTLLETRNPEELAEKTTEVTGSPGRRFSSSNLAAYERMGKSLKHAIQHAQESQRGIERLEDQVLRSDSGSSKKQELKKLADAVKVAEVGVDVDTGAMAYMRLPVPRLFRFKPRFHLTTLGLLAFIFTIWWVAESAMCTMYCRPMTCSGPCDWSPQDPEFGTAIPVKLDQWVTGGNGREAFAVAMEEVGDIAADVMNTLRGIDLASVDVYSLSHEGRRAHRRRLRKKGLTSSSPFGDVPPEIQARWDAWQKESMAKQSARAARDMGYGYGDDEEDAALGADQRIW